MKIMKLNLLLINRNYVKFLEEKINCFIHDDKMIIDSVNYNVCNISQFRFYLHTIVDNMTFVEDEKRNLELREIYNNEISKNDFTRLIVNGIIEVMEQTEKNKIKVGFEYYNGYHFDFE